MTGQAEPTAVFARIVVISDRVAAGEYEDGSGLALASAVRECGHSVDAIEVVADEIAAIVDRLTAAANDGVALVLTTGGTGFARRDITPEATERVIDRAAPGIAEAIRRASDGEDRGFGMRSRGVAGLIGNTIMVNLPGSTPGALEGWAVIRDHIPHLVDLVSGGDPH